MNYIYIVTKTGRSTSTYISWSGTSIHFALPLADIWHGFGCFGTKQWSDDSNVYVIPCESIGWNVNLFCCCEMHVILV